MILNDDILDAIRNKKYSLRKVEPPDLGPLKIVTIDNQSVTNRMLSRLIGKSNYYFKISPLDGARL